LPARPACYQNVGIYQLPTLVLDGAELHQAQSTSVDELYDTEEYLKNRRRILGKPMFLY
jgi:hypothetical protein